ncbi:MAG: hypothetical protein BMS9Abin09_0356 [Gammaproteobacteria bacterium]|nr:MAG: hypothetical protein BMS9Abin09_0356 [Gammaproteobacteria bacterium]
MRVLRFVRLWCCVIGLTGSSIVSATGAGDEEDLYDEGFISEFAGKPESESESGKKEGTVSLPPWPSEQDLITVDLSLVNFPYILLIDEKSFSVSEDRTIRYTAILRSAGGVDNVAYEGILCNNRQVKRYAYGSRGQFRPVRKPEWRFVRKKGQDRYRNELIESYFCPLPSGNRERQILDKLKTMARTYELEE